MCIYECINIYIYRQAEYKQTNRQTDRKTDRQTGRQRGRQLDRQTDRLSDSAIMFNMLNYVFIVFTHMIESESSHNNIPYQPYQHISFADQLPGINCFSFADNLLTT